MKKTKILSTASLFAGAFVGVNLAGYGNSAYGAVSSEKSYSQTLADFERELELRQLRAQRAAAKRSETQERRTDSDFVPAADSFSGRGVPAKGAAGDAAWSFSLGVEGFYAIAGKKIAEYDDAYNYYYEEDAQYYEEDVGDFKAPKVDLYGVNLRFTARKNDSLFDSANIVPEIYGIFGLGSGQGKRTNPYCLYEYNKYSGREYYDVGECRDKYSVLSGQLAFGANLRWIVNERFSVFGGVRAGLSYTSVEFEQTDTWEHFAVEYDGTVSDYEEDSETYKKTDKGVGFLCGAGVGCDIALNEHHALTLSADYLISTAKAEFKEFSIKSESQHYCVFSVGYKYTF